MKNKSFTPGQIICFTTGDYSSYGIETYLRVLQAFDSDSVREEYLVKFHGVTRNPKGKDRGRGQYLRLNLSPFLSWLEQSGYVQELTEVHKPVEWNFDEDCYVYQKEKN